MLGLWIWTLPLQAEGDLEVRLNVCGYCNKKVSWNNIHKVILYGYANMLCDDCIKSLNNEIVEAISDGMDFKVSKEIPKKYLDKKGLINE